MAAAWKHYFWAASSCSDTSAEKLLEACSHGVGVRLHPPKKKKKFKLPSSSSAKLMLGAPLHPRTVERFFTVIMSEEFFSKCHIGM